MPPAKKTVHVHTHTRRTASGKTTRVSGHNRTIDTWKQAGIAWAGTAGGLAITLALVLELGFALISTVATILTVLLGLAAAALTEKASRPKRRMRRKTRARPAARRRPAARTTRRRR